MQRGIGIVILADAGTRIVRQGRAVGRQTSLVLADAASKASGIAPGLLHSHSIVAGGFDEMS
jgi:hypothetical protein